VCAASNERTKDGARLKSYTTFKKKKSNEKTRRRKNLEGGRRCVIIKEEGRGELLRGELANTVVTHEEGVPRGGIRKE